MVCASYGRTARRHVSGLVSADEAEGWIKDKSKGGCESERLAAVGVRVVRRRGAMTNSPFSEFQGRGLSRRQYEAKAIQVAQIVGEVSADLYQLSETLTLRG